jgi:hypothetical protein
VVQVKPGEVLEGYRLGDGLDAFFLDIVVVDHELYQVLQV